MSGPRENGLRIGPRLRRAREEQGLTLEQVAARTALTKGFISQVERDRANPSVASLVRICRAIDLPVGHLFEPPSADLVRAAERRPIDFGGAGVREFLLTPARERRLQLIQSEVAPGGGSGEEPYALDSEAEVVHVLRGRLEVVLHEQRFALAAGDSLTFSPRTPHSWRNPSPDEPALVLWILAPAIP